MRHDWRSLLHLGTNLENVFARQSDKENARGKEKQPIGIGSRNLPIDV
ncbi:MAG: hypothetical protein IPK39_06450 [Sulfuritalea sp.]|nr:hypothetical protein [Sulfuritalea sp.]